ncbi:MULTISPECIES: hypothetical protein [Pandoraea]|uniref:VOC family protein n=1 Tax=Pandoraea communis TaxID=2508297 RepID=A0A5E4XPP8_9BURK|nr:MULTISPECIES: hypothetical protein [Pandoraea]VVE38213.1 VOC family protein [Pandoraea communis]
MLRVYTTDAVFRMPPPCCAAATLASTATSQSAAGQWQGALDTLQRWVDGVK